jgi:hypothetical protein
VRHACNFNTQEDKAGSQVRVYIVRSCLKTKTKQKQGWRHGSSGRAPAQQAQTHELKFSTSKKKDGVI